MFTSSLTDPSFSLLRTGGYINGQWTDAQDKATFDVTNPATGGLITRVSDLGAHETRLAIAAAENALPGWRALTAKARAQILRRWFFLVMENQEELAQLLSLEQANHWRNHSGKSPTVPALLNGLPKKASACTAKPFRPHRADSGSPPYASRSGWSVLLHRGTSRMR